jgi:hypothetical protein
VCQAPLPKIGGKEQPGICGKPLVQPKRPGRRRYFCGGTCRQRAKRRGYKQKAQSLVHADLAPRGPPPDQDATLGKVLKKLLEREEKAGVKQLIDLVETWMEEQRQIRQATQKQKQEAKIQSDTQAALAKRFGDWLASQADP